MAQQPVAVRKPLPSPDASTKFYWDAAKRHKLAILRCKQCGTFIHPPRPMCRTCQSSDLAPFEVSGRGKVYTFTTTHYIYHPAFQPAVPYVVALVELDDDPAVRIVSNIVDCPAGQVRIGMPVEVTFEDVSPEVSLPQFKPRKA